MYGSTSGSGHGDVCTDIPGSRVGGHVSTWSAGGTANGSPDGWSRLRSRPAPRLRRPRISAAPISISTPPASAFTTPTRSPDPSPDTASDPAACPWRTIHSTVKPSTTAPANAVTSRDRSTAPRTTSAAAARNGSRIETSTPDSVRVIPSKRSRTR